MRRFLLIAVAIAALGWTAGCSSGSGGPSISGVTSPAALNGQYAFVLSGFDTALNPISIAGSFKADGLGHITGAEIDVNDSGIVSSSNALQGSYAFDANGQNTLGTITLTGTVPNLGSSLVFGFALQASGASGDLMDLDANGFIVAGTMQQQNSSAFSLASLAADYVLKLHGTNSSAQTSAVGRFTLASSGATTNVAFDRSIAGKGTSGPSTDVTMAALVTFASAGPDANGRGTMTVAISDGLTSDTEHFAYYAVNSNQFVAIQIDPTGTMTAEASKQSAITANTVITAGSVFGVSGFDASIHNEVSAIGQLAIPSSMTGTMLWDFNDAGTPGTTMVDPTVMFDPTTGRGTLAILNGSANGLFDTAAFYLSASGTGFILDTTGGANSTTNRAMAGTLTAQTGAPFSATADLAGLSILRARGSAAQDAQAFVGLSGPPAGATGYLFLLDKRFPGTAPSTDQLLSNFSVTGPDAATGRGTMTVAGAETLTFYVIGPNQFLFIDTTPSGESANGPSPLYFVSPR